MCEKPKVGRSLHPPSPSLRSILSKESARIVGEQPSLFQNMSPKTLQVLLIAAAIFYLILPYDLVPDFFGLPGRLDDLVMMIWLAWLYQTRGAEWLGGGASKPRTGSQGEASEGDRSSRSRADGGGARANSGKPLADPHAVLGIGAGASAEEIRKAYRERMKEYHPDKVAHLGKELQDLALEKSQQIQRAYQQLSK